MPQLEFGLDSLENIKQSINEYIDSKNEEKNLFLLKHSSEMYSESNAISLKILLNKGYKGVFISFQRPLKNLYNWFEKNGLDKNKMVILDYSDSKDYKANELYKDITKKIGKISGEKKFVFIDSLNTMALCNSDVWVDDFTDRLVDNRSAKAFQNTVFIINVAKELSRKNIVKNFVSYADGIIDITGNSRKYSKDLTKNTIFT